MFGFLRRKPPPVKDFGFLQTDMHAHWLPGIDDGAKDLTESLALIQRFVALGYRKLIATPHVMADLYPNSPAIILEKLELVREAVISSGIEIELSAAAEYLIDEGFTDLLQHDNLLTLPGNRILIEFSFVSMPANFAQVLFTAQAKGYQVVLAHPERYSYLHDKPEQLRKLVAKGVELQINTLSLTDHYGTAVRKVAAQLLNEGIVKWLGSDAHRMDHLDKMGRFSRQTDREIVLRGKWHNSQL
ncbi:tyrosine-protein phosphatase YwqE [Lewinella marina]|uniref:protein-tyrosine-phosphatase n=1 Tax=Neolewinella marina TaxID=438751 RepID=A0A2G0CC05_9BACT|nr:CpsB/CapC family capsule biosynthesis tyrosine phosphatase [Neolewinella marina]NJB86684.1 tyrosine-protein phosphatase YwqE [Neolewinella marina]PHK97491.1 hypothetical protein CGL56_15445 [Neolewinella marina]